MGGGLKLCQLAYHQLMSQQGPHFSPYSRATANYKNPYEEVLDYDNYDYYE